MDDGAFTPSGFYLHTKGYTFQEVYKLAAILHYNFGLVCTIQSHENRPVIYIGAKELSKFKSLVTPYFLESMMYKFNPSLALAQK